jgi:hypothetical protein
MNIFSTHLYRAVSTVLLIFSFSALVLAQTIQLQVKRTRLLIYENHASPDPGPNSHCPCRSGAFDCSSDNGLVYPDIVINNRLAVNGSNYDLPQLEIDECYLNILSCLNYDNDQKYCIRGWASAGSSWGTGNPWTYFTADWFSGTNLPANSTLSVQMGAYEADHFLCGGDDAWCGGWRTIRTVNNIVNEIPVCNETKRDSVYCTSDDVSRWWGTETEINWQWDYLLPGTIDAAKNVCSGVQTLTIETVNAGTEIGTTAAWEFSLDNVTFNPLPVGVTYNSSTLKDSLKVQISYFFDNYFPTFNKVYFRKKTLPFNCTKPGIVNPAAVYSNVCVVNLKEYPTTGPVVTTISPNASAACSPAQLVVIKDPFAGSVTPMVFEYQLTYDGGGTWSPISTTDYTLVNTTNKTLPSSIRVRANYMGNAGCDESPWTTVSWTLYATPTAPEAITIFQPETLEDVCSTDSMYIIFKNGYGGGPASYDQIQYTTNGFTWNTYTSGQKIPTITGVGRTYAIRARRVADPAASQCNSTPFTYWGYWDPFTAPTAPTLNTKTPNTATVCSGTNVSATINGGTAGKSPNAINQYEYTIDGGLNWATYTSGTNISTSSAQDSVMIRTRRVDGNPSYGSAGPCSTPWVISAKWLVITPKTNILSASSILCHDPSAPYIELTAEDPSPGVGTWSVQQGAGTLSSTSALTTTVSGLTVGNNKIRWSVSQGGCTKSTTNDYNSPAVSLVNLTAGGVCRTCPVRNGKSCRFFDNTGKLMVKIDDQAAPVVELESTEVCVDIQASVQTTPATFGNQPFLQRRFTVKPVTNTNSAVTLYFTTAEFNNLKAAANGTFYEFSNVNDLIVSKFPGGTNNTYTAPNTPDGEYIIPSGSGLDANGYYFLTIPVSTFSTFYIHPIGASLGVLPLELISFNGEAEQDAIKLTWSTASESQLINYSLEKSKSGAGEWFPVTSIPAKNTAGLNEYIYTDTEPFDGENYYRIKIIETDESFSYTNIIKVRHEKEGYFFSVYPNPAKNQLFLHFKSKDPNNGIIRIVTVEGREILKKAVDINKGENEVQLNINLPSGIYMLNYADKDQHISHKFIVE